MKSRIRNNTSNYLTEHSFSKIRQANAKSPIALLVSFVCAAIIALLTAQPALASVMGSSTQKGTEANAAGIKMACSVVMGGSMDRKEPWHQNLKEYPLPAKTGRTWTLQEAFSSGTDIVNYHGEGKGTDWTQEKKTPTGNNYKKYASKYSDKLTNARTLPNCTITGVLNSIANLGINVADLITGISQFFATRAFDTELFCADPAKPTGDCFNIGKLIGGTGNSDGGIIGALTSSVYMSLLVIVVALSAGWILYIGIIKRKYREALFGAIWVILSVLIGLMLLLNPSIIAKAPMSASNIVATCIIGAFNGENCMDSSAKADGIKYTEGSETSSKICVSNVQNASVQQKMVLTTNSITCSIWKAFVLEPYAQNSFGMSFEDLDSNKGEIKNAIEEVGLEPKDFCVNLYSTKSYDQLNGKPLALNSGGKEVCNVLAYQMYLQVQAYSANDSVNTAAKIPSNNKIDDRWYKVVAVAAANDSTWGQWSGTPSTAMSKIMMSFIAVLTAGLGTFIIVVAAVFALVYYLGSVLLLTFAPVFFLMGIHPGRGKSLLLGWLEKIVANLLKYFFSAVFLIVTLAVYGAILSNVQSIGMTLMFVIIITMALFVFRNELLGLLGRVNMGGQQLSGALSNKLGNIARKSGSTAMRPIKMTQRAAMAGAGSAAGAMLASGKIGAAGRLGNGVQGAKEGFKRNLRRNPGVLGSAIAQYDRNSADNQRKLRQRADNVQESLIDKENDVVRDADAVEEASKNRKAIADQTVVNQNSLNDTEEKLQGVQNVRKDVLDEMSRDSKLESAQEINAIKNDPSLSSEEKEDRIAQVQAQHQLTIDFTNYQGLSNMIQDEEAKLKIAERSGNETDAMIHRQNIAAWAQQRDDIYDRVGAKNIASMRGSYDDAMSEKLKHLGLDEFNADDVNNYINLSVDVNQAGDKIELANAEWERANDQLQLSSREAAKERYRFESYNNFLNEMRPGQTMKDEMADRIVENVEKDLMNETLVDTLAESGKNSILADRKIEEVDNMPVLPSHNEQQQIDPVSSSGAGAVDEFGNLVIPASVTSNAAVEKKQDEADSIPDIAIPELNKKTFEELDKAARDQVYTYQRWDNTPESKNPKPFTHRGESYSADEAVEYLRSIERDKPVREMSDSEYRDLYKLSEWTGKDANVDLAMALKFPDINAEHATTLWIENSQKYRKAMEESGEKIEPMNIDGLLAPEGMRKDVDKRNRNAHDILDLVPSDMIFSQKEKDEALKKAAETLLPHDGSIAKQDFPKNTERANDEEEFYNQQPPAQRPKRSARPAQTSVPLDDEPPFDPEYDGYIKDTKQDRKDLLSDADKRAIENQNAEARRSRADQIKSAAFEYGKKLEEESRAQARREGIERARQEAMRDASKAVPNNAPYDPEHDGYIPDNKNDRKQRLSPEQIREQASNVKNPNNANSVNDIDSRLGRRATRGLPKFPNGSNGNGSGNKNGR